MRLERVPKLDGSGLFLKSYGTWMLLCDIDAVKGLKLGRDVVRLVFWVESLPDLVKNRVTELEGKTRIRKTNQKTVTIVLERYGEDVT